MKKLMAILTIAAVVSGCAMQKDKDEGVVADVFNPFTPQTWRFVGAEGKRCAITSGHNGLNIIIEKTNGDVSESVSSGHNMRPSELMRLNVNNHYYRTASEKFSPRDSKLIIEDFKTGDVAYIEWSNLRPFQFDAGPKRASNILQLDNFKQVYGQCLKEIS